MKRRIGISILASSVCLALVLFGGLSVSGAETYTMRVGHSMVPEGPRDKAAKLFKSMAEKKSGGKLKVEVYPASQLGDNRQMIEGVQLGTIEAVIQPTAFMGGFAPILTVFDLPFLFPTQDITMKVAYSDAGKGLMENLEKIGIKAAGFWAEGGFKQFTNNKRAIRTPEDYKGLKVRTMPTPIIMEIFKAYGATPVPISFDELYNSLQLGTVDGQDNRIGLIYEMKLFEVQKYLTISDYATIVELFAVSKKWYDKLPADVQKVIVETVQEIAPIRRSGGEKQDEESLGLIQKTGKTEIYKLTAAERELFRQRSLPVHQKFVEMTGKEGGAVLETFKKKIEELQKR
jgi:C4-dicarboxylate-binding protein DctP